jgi:hypothetical protein
MTNQQYNNEYLLYNNFMKKIKLHYRKIIHEKG